MGTPAQSHLLRRRRHCGYVIPTNEFCRTFDAMIGMTGFDIIGDIHRVRDRAQELLGGLGYKRNDWTGAYWHPRRQAIFVGDLIDRGDEQLRVLKIVKPMVDSGSAQIVMGNHEFNALAYATEYPAGSGCFLRKHTAKNGSQHGAFLDQLSGEQRAHYVRGSRPCRCGWISVSCGSCMAAGTSRRWRWCAMR